MPTRQKKEILSSKGKISAFAKIGKTIECPSDFPGILGNVNRNNASINKAESQITLPEDRLRAMLFWFWNLTPVDTIAFNHFRTGNIDKAIEIWSKVTNISSLQNSAVCFLIQGKLDLTVSIAEILYEYHTDELKKIFDCVGSETNEQTFINIFVHSVAITDKTALIELYPNIKSEKWKSTVKAELARPLLENINKEISTT